MQILCENFCFGAFVLWVGPSATAKLNNKAQTKETGTQKKFIQKERVIKNRQKLDDALERLRELTITKFHFFFENSLLTLLMEHS